MRDLYHNLLPAKVIDPGIYKTGVNPTDTTLDLLGFEGCHLILYTGTITDAQTLTVQDSDVVGSGYVDVVAADVQGDLAAFKAIAAGDDNVIKSIGYVGAKRYIQVKCTGAGATGGAFAVVAEKGRARRVPVV